MNGNRVMDILYRRASEKEYRAVPIQPRSIDEGLFGSWNQRGLVPSEENRRDVVHRVSQVRPKGTPWVLPGRRVVIDMFETEGLYSDVFIHPTGKTIPGLQSLKTFQKENSRGTPR